MKIALAASLIGAASAAKEYVVSPVNRDYDNGMEYCLKNGMSPGSIHSKADQAAVMAAMKLVKVNKAYAGAEETFTNGIYKWNDGSKWDYFHDKNDGLKNGGETKLVITTWGAATKTGYWHDWGTGSSRMAVICSKDKMEPSKADYVVVKEQQTFSDGIESCIALGRETASVHSWVDNHAVKMEMKAKKTYLAYLGADEIFKKNGQYLWLDGTKWDYMATWNDKLNKNHENKVAIVLTGGHAGWHDWLKGNKKMSMVCGVKINVCEAKNCEHWTCKDWCSCYDSKDESLYATNGCNDDGEECVC